MEIDSQSWSFEMESDFNAPAAQAVVEGHAEDDVVIDSVALARLLDEVRNEEPVSTTAYNRTYNRHNR